MDIIASMHGMQIIGCTTPLKYYGVRKVRRVIKSLYHLALKCVLSSLLCALPIVLPLGWALELVLGWNLPFRFQQLILLKVYTS